MASAVGHAAFLVEDHVGPAGDTVTPSRCSSKGRSVSQTRYRSASYLRGVGGHQPPGGVLELPVGRLGSAGQEEAGVEEVVDLGFSRHVAGGLGGLRDGAHHVVDGLAVAEFRGQPGLEADQVAQPERQSAVDERGEFAVGDRDGIARRPVRRVSIAGSDDVLWLHLKVGKLPVVRAGAPRPGVDPLVAGDRQPVAGAGQRDVEQAPLVCRRFPRTGRR